MPETKTNRQKMKEQLLLLDQSKMYLIASGGEKTIHISETAPFKNLWKIANQEVHPSGDQILLSNESIYSWERLISMRDEAYSFPKHTFDDVARILDDEIKRRLLALLDK